MCDLAQIVSCGEDQVRIDLPHLEVQHTDFAPEADMHMGFLPRHRYELHTDLNRGIAIICY